MRPQGFLEKFLWDVLSVLNPVPKGTKIPLLAEPVKGFLKS
jgi:hypothetical protein